MPRVRRIGGVSTGVVIELGVDVIPPSRPIVMRRLMFAEPFDPKLVPALVDQAVPA